MNGNESYKQTNDDDDDDDWWDDVRGRLLATVGEEHTTKNEQ